jgi:hypothetical protein
MLHEFFMKLEAIKSQGFYQSKCREDEDALMFMRECGLVRRINEQEYNQPGFIGMPHLQVYLTTPEGNEFYNEVLKSRPQLAGQLSMAHKLSQ